MAGVRHCTREGLITGIATSVCRSNIDELATQAFVDKAVALGVQYLWYHIYRPVGPMPCPELALSEAQITWLRRFLVEVRERAPIMIVDAYWDHEGRALCPAAVGISHHIGPSGDIEPCPPIQFAADRIRSGQDLAAVFNNSRFLHDFAGEAAAATRGCLLLESPARLGEVVRRCGAHATSGREAGMAELDAMGPLPSHHLPGREVPERNWFYRLAKKNWFFGFGAYG
jgi:MoaA/NifB/PqqE/SkfB family radical SAM enzyme